MLQEISYFYDCICKLPGETTAEYIRLACRTGEIMCLGTQYTGEMKKGMYSVMHYLMPKHSILPLHAGCNLCQHCAAGVEQTLFI